jgi:hypothetical protein
VVTKITMLRRYGIVHLVIVMYCREIGLEIVLIPPGRSIQVYTCLSHVGCEKMNKNLWKLTKEINEEIREMKGKDRLDKIASVLKLVFPHCVFTVKSGLDLRNNDIQFLEVIA